MSVSHSTPISPLERQILLQLGDRLRALRKSLRMGTVEMAEKAGISRMTLSAIESGSPSPSMGNYVRVMSVLGVSGELAMLASDTLQPAPAGTAAARSTHERPEVTIKIQAKSRLHQAQDLQSLALHEAAVSKIEKHPEALQKVVRTLEAWREANPDSRSMSLWEEWGDILRTQAWRKALGPTQRAKQLRQASPLAFVLSEEERRRIIAQVNALKHGVTLGGADAHADTLIDPEDAS
ncbi:helix-turn-helix transcriptional regulator [Pelomonas sp. KK5]|uniref:helix-turn-helix transcriptional regulator n=1 Tax=Pelomonas sp. KK5 TaxID=1855730 RepID=UPI00097C895B|nr:helix-turn-helix transcriptional regulator [Pelomonas sp. KK5]